MKRAVLAFAILFGLCFIGTGVDNDAWFLLNSGRYVESSGVPHVEPFTMHEGWHFVMQQWLFALGLWELYSAFGTAGLVAFAWGAGAVILLLFERLVRLTADGNRAAAIMIVLPVGCYLGAAFFRARPQTVSTIVFLIEILLLERYKETRPRWLFVLFPVLSALLVNLHAAMWPMMLVFLLPYLAEALAGGRLAARVSLPHDSAWRVRELLLLAVLVAAAGLVGPNGLDAVTYTAHAYGNPDISRSVNEMAPMSLRPQMRLVAPVMFYLFALIAIYARHAVPLRHLLLAGGTALMALLSVRSIFLFLLFATFPLGRLLRGWAPRSVPWTRARTLRCGALAAVLVAAMCQLLHPLYEQPPVPQPLAAAADALAEIAAHEGRKPADYRIYASYKNGGWFEFHGFRSYIDARAEVFTPQLNHDQSVLHEYLDTCYGWAPYRPFLDRYAFDAVVVDRSDVLWDRLASDADYEIAWDSEAEGIAGSEDDALRIYRRTER